MDQNGGTRRQKTRARIKSPQGACVDMPTKAGMALLLNLIVLLGHLHVNLAQSLRCASGLTFSIDCSPLGFIDVTSALHGRSGTEVDRYCLSTDMEPPFVYASQAEPSLAEVKRLCQNTQECDLAFTANDTYLVVDYQCLDYTSSPQDICNGTERFISCGYNQVIDVTSALWGREGGREDDVCGIGEFTPCGNAENALSAVKDLCQYKHRCSIAVNSVFNASICGADGEAYLHVVNTCLEQTPSPGKACDGEELLIQCRPTEHINVTRALYGRQQGVGDVSCPIDEAPNCTDAGASLTAVRDICQNKHQCTIPVDDVTLGPNPCEGRAYLLVWNTCLDQTTSPQEVNEGVWISINCGSTQYISITSAVYDKASGDNTTCTADPTGFPTDATQVVRRKCQDLHECNFLADDEFFGGDPCQGVDKVLRVDSACLDHTSTLQEVIEGRQIYLRCPVNQFIRVETATYGVAAALTNDCVDLPGALGRVQEKCDNKTTECGFIVSDAFFRGDPCPSRSDKTLQVTVGCMDQEFLYTFESPTYMADEGDGSIEVVVLRNGSPFSSTIGVTARDDTAVQASDYTFPNQSLEYDAKDSSRTLTIPIEDDSAVEEEECFTLAFAFPMPVVNVNVGAYDPQTTQVCITDNDIDDEPPVLNCPGNITKDTEMGEDSCVVAWSSPTVTDNSGEVLQATLTTGQESPSSFLIGTHSVIYEATDSSSNTGYCSFTIEIKDVEPPVVTGCPAQHNLTTEQGEPYGIGDFPETTAQDNSGEVFLSGGGNPRQLYPIGVTQTLYIAADPSGNVERCTVTVEVRDEENPYLVAPSECPSDIEVFIQDSGAVRGLALWTVPDFADNSGEEPTVDIRPAPLADYSYPIGTTEVTIRAQDDHQNFVECTFSIVVHEYDATPPQVLPCPPDIQSLLTDPGSDTASPIPFDVVAVDEQSGIRESSLSHGLPYSIGQNTVSLSAVNNAGVVGNCRFVVTVLDEENPEILNCPGIQTVSTRGASRLGYPTWPVITASDNSNDVRVTCSKESGDAFELGDTTVVCTARDPSDNGDTCSFTVTVIDDNECSTSSAVNQCATQGLSCFNHMGGYSCDCPVGLCRSPAGSCLQGKLFVIVFIIYEMDGNEAVFTNDLNQPLSYGFLFLQDRVQIILDTVFTDLSGFCRSSVVSFFSGSIGVTALVSVSESSSATLADVTQHLTDAINSDDFLLGSDLRVRPNPSVVPAEVCYDGYCQNGGTCSTDSANYLASCLCPTGFTGDRCEERGSGDAAALAVGLAVGGLILLVLLASVLACIVLRRRPINATKSDGLYQEDDGREGIRRRRPLYYFTAPSPTGSPQIFRNKALEPPATGFFSPYVADGGASAVPRAKRAF